MSQTLVIHAGTYKTGTTALQWFLHENRELLHDRGLYWPAIGAGDGVASWGHHALVQNLNKKSPRDEWRKLLHECAGEQQAVISSELFSNIRQVWALRPITRIFEGWTIKAVVYFRRQDRYLESLYNHHVKAVGEVNGIDAFAQKMANRLDYRTYVRALSQAFGAENIIVRPYEPGAMHGDICEDFLFTLGIDMPEGARLHKLALNPGLAQRGIELMLQANRRYQNDVARLAKVRQEIICRHAAPPHYDHQLLDEEGRKALLDTHRTGNLWIARNFLSGQRRLFSD